MDENDRLDEELELSDEVERTISELDDSLINVELDEFSVLLLLELAELPLDVSVEDELELDSADDWDELLLLDELLELELELVVSAAVELDEFEVLLLLLLDELLLLFSSVELDELSLLSELDEFELELDAVGSSSFKVALDHCATFAVAAES